MGIIVVICTTFSLHWEPTLLSSIETITIIYFVATIFLYFLWWKFLRVIWNLCSDYDVINLNTINFVYILSVRLVAQQ